MKTRPGIDPQQLNANYRHSTVYIWVIQYSQIIIVLLILIQLKQIKN
jgi:hypothetical protein